MRAILRDLAVAIFLVIAGVFLCRSAIGAIGREGLWMLPVLAMGALATMAAGILGLDAMIDLGHAIRDARRGDDTPPGR